MRKALLAILSFGLVGCQEDGVYTLYRSSMIMAGKVHVATFDSKDGNDYNAENCKLARDLFLKQEGVKVQYWCEPGRFKR